MELYLKITVVVLLLPQVFHLASLEVTTDSPRRGIDKEWLRQKLLKNSSPEGETETDQGTESSDYSDGTSSGSMAPYNEDENLTSQMESENRTSDITTNTYTNTNETIDASINANTETNMTASTSTNTDTNMTANTNTNTNTSMTANTNTNITEVPTFPENLQPTNQSQPTQASKDNPYLWPSRVNITDTDEETTTPHDSTTPSPAQISTRSPEFSNGTDMQATTVASESSGTNETKPGDDAGLTNSTDATDVTNASTAAPEVTDAPTTLSPSQTTEWIAEPTTSTADATAVPPSTPTKANMTGNDGGSGSNADRGTGVASNTNNSSSRSSPWGAILGTLVAVAFVGFVAYIILKKKNQKAFSHRKLVEEFPSDPVLRLDNSEPLDLNFGGSAYYNPGLQGDNIQMSNFPARH